MENQILTEDFKEKKNAQGHAVLHHDETGEPVFDINKGFGRDVGMSWHAHQLSMHPTLNHSFEFKDLGSYDSKSTATAHATAAYKEAARAGFKDVVPHTISKMSDEEYDKRASSYENTHHYDRGYISRTGAGAEKAKTMVTFHDPENNMKIAHVEYDAETGTRAIKYNQEYMKHHNITDAALQTYHTKGLHNSGVADADTRSYHAAKEVYLNKNKQPRLTGVEHKSSGHEYQSFKIGSSPEQASAAHEEHVRSKYPAAQITRHSPLHFMAHEAPNDKYATGKMIHSSVIGDTLHATVASFSHPEYFAKNANNMVIESTQA